MSDLERLIYLRQQAQKTVDEIGQVVERRLASGKTGEDTGHHVCGTCGNQYYLPWNMRVSLEDLVLYRGQLQQDIISLNKRIVMEQL